MVQTNVPAIAAEKFHVIEEAPASDISLGIIYTTVLKIIAVMSTMLWIFDLGTTRDVSTDWTRFPDLIAYNDFYYTASGEQFAIKDKENINLAVKDTMLRLLDALHVLGLMLNLISTTRL